MYKKYDVICMKYDVFANKGSYKGKRKNKDKLIIIMTRGLGAVFKLLKMLLKQCMRHLNNLGSKKPLSVW